MTLLVGILCDHGVVMATDSAATYASSGAPTIGQQSTQKLIRINDHILYAGTGAVGVAQLLSHELHRLWEEKKLRDARHPAEAMNVIGQTITKVVGTYLQSATWLRQLGQDTSTSLCKSLVAAPVDKKPQLFQFDHNGAPEFADEHLSFVALGSGQAIADPFLAHLKKLWLFSQLSG
ncbi:MAG: hypothetical protein ACT4P6_14945 [Gemmatimonadaceae bacterium]